MISDAADPSDAWPFGYSGIGGVGVWGAGPIFISVTKGSQLVTPEVFEFPSVSPARIADSGLHL